MQAAFQKPVDAAVSKKVNLPSDVPPSAVKEILMLAHDLQLKGSTVYRYGCRPGQTISLIDEDARPDCRECGAQACRCRCPVALLAPSCKTRYPKDGFSPQMTRGARRFS
jgi:ribonucleotide reductase alpha subunit